MKRVLVTIGVFATLAAATVSCRATVVQPTGYEAGGGYMQPDHGYWYYHWLYWSTLGMYQPSVTYHVYVPPAGYPATYRPWYRDTYRAPSRGPVMPREDPRRTGGFSTPPSSGTASSPRTAGGFSTTKPSQTQASPPPRSSGGFSSRPSSPPRSSPRTSGGFGKR